MESAHRASRGGPALPLEAQYLYRQGLHLSSEGKKEEALRSFRMAVLIAPRFCNAYNAMGNCLDELGRYDAAMMNYGKVLEIDPLHTEARFKRELLRSKISRRAGRPGETPPARHAGQSHYRDPFGRNREESDFFRCLVFSHEAC